MPPKKKVNTKKSPPKKKAPAQKEKAAAKKAVVPEESKQSSPEKMEVDEGSAKVQSEIPEGKTGDSQKVLDESKKEQPKDEVKKDSKEDAKKDSKEENQKDSKEEHKKDSKDEQKKDPSQKPHENSKKKNQKQKKGGAAAEEKSPSYFYKEAMRKSKTCFKALVCHFLKNKAEGQFLSEVISADMKLQIQENFPFLILNDGKMFLQGLLTGECWEKVKGELQGKEFSEMANQVMEVKQFQLMLRQVKSKEIFTCYGSLEVCLVVHQGSILYMSQPPAKKFSHSVFKDDEVRTYLLHFLHRQMRSHCQCFSLGFPDCPGSDISLKSSSHPPIFVQGEEDEGFSKFFDLETPQATPAFVSMEDIILEERGKEFFHMRMEERRRGEEERKARDAGVGLAGKQKLVISKYAGKKDMVKIQTKQKLRKARVMLNATAELLGEMAVAFQGKRAEEILNVGKVEMLEDDKIGFIGVKRYVDWLKEQVSHEGVDSKVDEKCFLFKDLCNFYSRFPFDLLLLQRSFQNSAEVKEEVHAAEEESKGGEEKDSISKYLKVDEARMEKRKEDHENVETASEEQQKKEAKKLGKKRQREGAVEGKQPAQKKQKIN